MNNSHRFNPTAKPAAVWLCAALGLGVVALDALAATDLAPTPLITAAPNAVKPNIMFILDDSGSMGSDFMPDDAAFETAKYGRYAAQCNGLAYNPTINYGVPVDATGANYADGTYTFIGPNQLANIRTVSSPTAPALVTGSVTLQLSSFGNNAYYVNDYVTVFSSTDTSKWLLAVITSVDSGNDRLAVNVVEVAGTGTLASPQIGDGHHRPFYYNYTPTTGSPAALSYSYTSSGVATSATFYQECNSVVGTAPGSGRFARVVVTSGSADIQNYRNWNTYYRTRSLMMRTATSLAFKDIGDKYRVGFSTISSTTVDGSKFLDASDFDATQKATWYSRLFSANPSGYTPLRGALAKSGTYFAKRGKLSDGTAQTYDPMQFSCQKNFAILTTDGYWNNNNESSTYGPYRLDGSNVGQQDGAAARPMRDGGVETYTSTTPMSQVKHWFRTRTQTQRSTEQYTEYQTQSCGGGRKVLAQRTVSRSRDATNTETSYYASTETYNSVVTYTGGVASAAIKQNVVSGAYANERTPVTTGFTGGAWSSWTSGSWATSGACTGSVTAPANTAVTTSTGAASAWSTYSSYSAATPASDTAVTTGPATESARTTSGGSSDSLADVAMYYYETDLRTAALGNCVLANGTNVCLNNVPPRGADNSTQQHMTTFTVGLGVNGTLGYHANYLGGASPDFQAITAGTKNWPNPGQGLGAENIDDLWHAAVNGRGQYFSAGDPAIVARSLSETLAAIDARTGTASAAATSSLQPVEGDSTEYVTSYTTVQWVGDVVSYQVDPFTGTRATTADWSAQQRLDARVAAGTPRNIYYMQRTAGSNRGTLRPFTYANLQADGLNAHFDGACSKVPALSQCTNASYDVAGANSGTNLVTWLRGQSDARYRGRQHLLGDTVGGAPVYVRKPPFSYSENDYQGFVSTINSSNGGTGRRGVVYVPSNDGMLHAFDGATGQELWAYVPTMVMSRMYRLADNDYATKHEYFVNATPVVSDIWVPSAGAWKTILVGGLGAGGRGYYALDITNPDSPSVMWEFANDSLGGNDNLGLTFGNPVVTKRMNGQWVVVFASGYNNVSPGDGNGRLFVVDASTGQRLTEVRTYTAGTTAAGNTATPSGLSKINNWVESPRDNTSLRYYGGDLLGNVWRFDIDGQVAPNNTALLLAQLRAGSPAAAQPVTTKPELATVAQGGAKHPVVYVATGKLLGLSDLSSSAQQTVYAIKDPLTDTPLGNLQARSDMVRQTLTENATTRVRTVTNLAVDWSTQSGWMVDFVTPGERVNVDMRLALTTLVVGTNAPANDACTSGGTSYLYKFDYTSGSSPPGANGEAGVWLGNSFNVGVGVMQTLPPAGSTMLPRPTICRIQMGDGTVRLCTVPPPPPASIVGRRTSWRELIN
jgi:type IV pilus assembly protein PilY1